MKNSHLTIGDNVQVSATTIWAYDSITIGNNVKIGGGCIILDSDAHSLDYKKRRDNIQDQLDVHTAPIIIEDDALIGANTIILKGVTIGARSIIGSGSVVTKSIPSDCIAAGNPCRLIKEIK